MFSFYLFIILEIILVLILLTVNWNQLITVNENITAEKGYRQPTVCYHHFRDPVRAGRG